MVAIFWKTIQLILGLLLLLQLSSVSFRFDCHGPASGPNRSTGTTADAFSMGAKPRGRTIDTAQGWLKIKPFDQIWESSACSSSSIVEVKENYATNPGARRWNRRHMLSSTLLGVGLSLAVVVPSATATSTALPINSLQDIAIGQGVWTAVETPRTTSSGPASSSFSASFKPSASFSTYATRFLIQYDKAVNQWWSQVNDSYQLLPPDQRQQQLGRAFGSLAKSIQQAFETTNASSSDLYERFVSAYGDCDDDARRQIALLFSLLPPEEQPIAQLDSYAKQRRNVLTMNQPAMKRRLLKLSRQVPLQPKTSTTLFGDDLSRLLPNIFHIVPVPASTNPSVLQHYTIEPAFTLYEIGIGSPDTTFGLANTATTTTTPTASTPPPPPATTAVITATAFGPLASSPLVRDRPDYSFALYGWLGIAGATACCLTHAIVIPLDVVKTRAQTSGPSTNKSNNNNNNTRSPTFNSNKSKNVFQAAMTIAKEEGIDTLLLGAQATLVGYFWYGLSVYPSYTFAKRTLSNALSPELGIAHANELALVAGALAAVVASLGLTPLEAARIRAVANPSVYRPLGLVGTLQVIANETMKGDGKNSGGCAIGNLYAGLPSLLARQVIFGSVKFLAFERACEYIFGVSPGLREATWTTLAVSLVAGGLSGILSSVVSQPADCLLTYVAAKGGSTNIGLLDGARTMIMEEGPGCLFRGLGSRCVWAGSIIAGQFLLYDIFRTVFGVNSENLNQVFQLQV